MKRYMGLLSGGVLAAAMLAGCTATTVYNTSVPMSVVPSADAPVAQFNKVRFNGTGKWIFACAFTGRPLDDYHAMEVFNTFLMPLPPVLCTRQYEAEGTLAVYADRMEYRCVDTQQGFVMQPVTSVQLLPFNWNLFRFNGLAPWIEVTYGSGEKAYFNWAIGDTKQLYEYLSAKTTTIPRSVLATIANPKTAQTEQNQ